MRLVKSMLLGSAAGLAAVAGAQAADLPMRKAAPVEYVRVCSAYGAGFFYIPGTDTCLRVGGRARFEYEYRSQRDLNTTNDNSGYRGLGRLNIDARTQTAYGTLRAFVRLEVAKRSGTGILRSGSSERSGESFFGTSADTFGKLQTTVVVDKAFIQFAGITAGRAASFFDFYAHDVELTGLSAGSDQASTTLLAYTLTFGQGFSATISLEDPAERRQNVFTIGGTLPFSAVFNGAGTSIGVGSTTQPVAFSSFVSPVASGLNAAGNPATFGLVDIRQRNRMPDIVGSLRYDASWGALQLSGAVHEIYMGLPVTSGLTTTGVGLGGTGALAGTAAAGVIPGAGAVVTPLIVRHPDAEYGWAIQGGAKFNLPWLAAGDVLWLQAAYGEGATNYVGTNSYLGLRDNQQPGATRTFNVNTDDAALDAFGNVHTTKAFSVVGALLHYWTPQWRSAFTGSYAAVDFDSVLRTRLGPAGLTPFAFPAGTALTVSAPFTGSGPALAALSPILRDYNVVTASGSLIWSPVRDLDIGVEGVYVRTNIDSGRVIDANKNIAVNPATGAIGAPNAANLAAGFIPKTITYDDQFIGRLRIQRDF
jgi:hypothetical protein